MVSGKSPATGKRGKGARVKQGQKRVKLAASEQDRHRAVTRLTHQDLEERQYLHGLLDTNHPSRGPSGEGLAGTFIATTQATVPLVYKPYDPAGYSRLPGEFSGAYAVVTSDGVAPFSVVSSDKYLDSNAGFMLCISPQPAIINDGVNPSEVRGWDLVGMSSATDALLKQSFAEPYDPVIAAGSTAPIGLMAYTSPGLRDMSRREDGSSEFSGRIDFECPRRCVGLRARLTVTQNAFSAQGTLIGGHNGDFLASAGRVQYTHGSSGDEVHLPSATECEASEYTFADYERFQYINNAGPAVAGTSVEATWVPSSDVALQYIDSLSCIVGRPSGAAFTASHSYTPAVMAMSAPTVFLGGLGLAATTDSPWTATLEVVANWEVQVRPNYSIAWNIGEARLAHRYWPDWSELAGVPPVSGQHGAIVSAVASSYKVAHGRALRGHDYGKPVNQATASTTNKEGASNKGVADRLASAVATAEDVVGSGKKALNVAKEAKGLWADVKSLMGKAEQAAPTFINYAEREIPAIADRAAPLAITWL